MDARRFLVLFLLTQFLAGCGTYVPEIQENPFATERERSDFIQAIVRNVRCEVQDAVVRLYADNRDIDPYNRNLKWFDSFGMPTRFINTQPWMAAWMKVFGKDESIFFLSSFRRRDHWLIRC